MDNENNKLNIPYYQVAKAALMERYELSEGDAIDEIENFEWKEIEKKVDAFDSLTYATDKISKLLNFTNNEEERLLDNVFNGGIDAIELMKSKFEEKGINPTTLVIDTLFAVHDGWVEGHPEEFMAKDRKYQHMPSELMGWEEAKKHLLFIKPIFEAAGIQVNEEELEKEYNRRVKEFFLDKKIYAPSDLIELLAKGEKFYPALKGQTEIVDALKDEEFVVSIVIPQIEENGIGKTHEVKDQILEDIAQNPKVEDLERLTEPEKVIVDLKISEMLDKATKKLAEEKNKNNLIREILNKYELLEKTNMEIETEKNKRLEKNINNKEINEIIPKKDDSDGRNDFGE